MKKRAPVSIHIAVTFGLLIMAFEMFAGDSDYLSSPLFWALILIVTILLLIMNSIEDLVENENFKKLSEKEKQLFLQDKSTGYFKKLWNSAFKKQSPSEETDILIDHGFDGITELDNALPRWWIGLFYFGIIFCAVYMTAFAFTDYAHPDAELNAETKIQLASINEYEKNTPAIDLQTAKYNADYITEGEHLFKTNCVSCHSEGGRGGIGPNLTDNYWINIKEKTVFRNVFWMLENGSPNNPAMRPFIKEGTITGKDAEKIAAYIHHINQEKAPISEAVGGAAPQGEPAKWEQISSAE
ncbi:cbb3-type cytochrome c oxidase N-terminal domain-containing protein [Chryseobacterium wangxinyae]|uniref:cbb3-type cytochrome c oxidase N-terminal domain-containing protein n=1 Tax=Chryseobacterium sp. CY353 TaxID=2997334 RepID=UPI00226D7050|nr:cbb3-type cytochrome c oxidase N-terminal domain-containing protein [Chryseobacterium sp. CY353]MCY0970130.1 c-type cytochrome [Chryseobacterium sp. CY353]